MIELVPMSSVLIKDAAELLSAAWVEPHATGCCAAVAIAEQRIEAFQGKPSVAALQEGRLVCYLTAQPPRLPVERFVV